MKKNENQIIANSCYEHSGMKATVMYYAEVTSHSMQAEIILYMEQIELRHFYYFTIIILQIETNFAHHAS